MRSRWSKGIHPATFAVLILSMGILPVTAMPATAQTSSPNPHPGPSCGWNGPLNGGGIVASTPSGSDVAVTIGEPSWQQDCFSFPGAGGSTSGTSFPAYEVFPITIRAPQGMTFRLEAGQAIPSAQQIAEDGVRNTTIWTWFNPESVVINSSGVARSNLTLVGAVMPFVPNDISNVSLPISAVAASGVKSTVSLPIEFTGGNWGGVVVLQAPGPISFGAGIEGQAGNPSDPLFSVVYSPAGSATAATPLEVSLKVLGTYDNGKVGPMPSDVQVSFPQPSFELAPYSVFYFPVSENNSLKPSSLVPSANYVFALQEKVGNSTYVVPLSVSVSLVQIFAGGTAQRVGPSLTSGSSDPLWANAPFLVAVAIIAVAASLVFVLWRGRGSRGKEENPLVDQR